MIFKEKLLGKTMDNTGGAEMSESNNNAKYSLSFWQIFLVTLFGAAGLISMIADGPLWLTVSGFSLVIVFLLWFIYTPKKK